MAQTRMGPRTKMHPRIDDVADLFPLPFMPMAHRIEFFLQRAQTQHLFAGMDTQCYLCWGWVDDPRHIGDPEWQRPKSN